MIAFLICTVPLTVGILAGAKFDRREAEQFLSTNVQAAVRYRRFVLLAEHYWKDEREFDSKQAAWHGQVGFLAIPKYLMLAADYGEFQAEPFRNQPDPLQSTVVREPNDEMQYRLAAHYYYYRDIGVLSLVYGKRIVEKAKGRMKT